MTPQDRLNAIARLAADGYDLAFKPGHPSDLLNRAARFLHHIELIARIQNTDALLDWWYEEKNPEIIAAFKPIIEEVKQKYAKSKNQLPAQ